jgi:hypothetical protein
MKLLASLFCLFVAIPLAAQAPPQPTAEHQKLAAEAGTWDAVMEMPGEDGKPITSKGVSERKMALGGFWLIDDFSATMMGMPFQGHGLTGYDPVKGKYVQSWSDSTSPMLMVMEGSYDKTGKVMTMTGMGPGMDGKPVQYRHVSTWKDANSMLFEMFVIGADGSEMPMLKVTYTRRVAKVPTKTDK